MLTFEYVEDDFFWFWWFWMRWKFNRNENWNRIRIDWIMKYDVKILNKCIQVFAHIHNTHTYYYCFHDGNDVRVFVWCDVVFTLCQMLYIFFVTIWNQNCYYKTDYIWFTIFAGNIFVFFNPVKRDDDLIMKYSWYSIRCLMLITNFVIYLPFSNTHT